MSRALSFGVRAESYERFRPGYPVELFELVAGYAGGPVRSALEIGAGTGKATRLFAGCGVRVTASDPDEGMLAELRRHVPSSVTVVRGAFEELEPGERFGLVFAAAALHWTRPEGRWERVASWLEPGGVVASFGGPMELVDPVVAEAVRVARAPFLERDDVPSPDGTGPEEAMQWPGTELVRSPLFTDVRQEVIGRRLWLSAAEFVGHLSTVSAYAELPVGVRVEALDAVGRVLPERVEVGADIFVHLARRVDV